MQARSDLSCGHASLGREYATRRAPPYQCNLPGLLLSRHAASGSPACLPGYPQTSALLPDGVMAGCRLWSVSWRPTDTAPPWAFATPPTH
jgi:hypothetical protein